MNIGNVIKELRKQNGHNQKTFASLCGITPTSLSLIESGAKKPSPRTIKEICRVLNIKESVLYILSLEKDDVPESKREIFDTMFPHIKSMLFDISKE